MEGTKTVPLSLCPGTAPTSLPATSAVLGPCSPAAAIHLALGFIDLTSLPEFNSTEEPDPSRVLIVTGPRHVLQSAIDTEDEHRLREPIPELGRVDVRYCPSWRHAALLLSLLTPDLNPSTTELVEKPGLIVLSDLSGMFDQDRDEGKENVPPLSLADEIAMGGEGGESGEGGEGIKEGGEGKRKLSKDAWNYLSLVSAAKQAASSLGAALVVLEHQPCPLPLPTSNRCVEMSAALQKLLGHVVTISDIDEGDFEVRQSGESFGMRRREVVKDEYALPPIRTGNEETGWAWSWV